MSYSMVKRLILKDWYFQRWTIVGYLAAGALALGLITIRGNAWFFAGSILLITVLIAVGIHLAMATVVEERKEHTLTFVMSLPVSPWEYTTAKILANLSVFLVLWITLLLGALTLFLLGNHGGMIPFTAIILTEILASNCLILAIALVSESQNWTIGAIVFGNLLFQGFLYYVSHIPSIASVMKGPGILWNRPEVALLSGEFATIALLLGLTFFFQARKTDFL